VHEITTRTTPAAAGGAVTPAEVQALLTRQAQQLSDLEHTVADLRATGTPPAGPAEGQAVPFLYGSLPEFVEAVVAPLYAKHGTSGGGWCASWWAHEEARVRLGAVWRAWETPRLDPSIGIAWWLRDVADPQMDRLRDPAEARSPPAAIATYSPTRSHYSNPQPTPGRSVRTRHPSTIPTVALTRRRRNAVAAVSLVEHTLVEPRPRGRCRPYFATVARMDEDRTALSEYVRRKLRAPWPTFRGGYPEEVEAALQDAVLSIRNAYGTSPTTGGAAR